VRFYTEADKVKPRPGLPPFKEDSKHHRDCDLRFDQEDFRLQLRMPLFCVLYTYYRKYVGPERRNIAPPEAVNAMIDEWRDECDPLELDDIFRKYFVRDPTTVDHINVHDVTEVVSRKVVPELKNSEPNLLKPWFVKKRFLSFADANGGHDGFTDRHRCGASKSNRNKVILGWRKRSEEEWAELRRVNAGSDEADPRQHPLLWPQACPSSNGPSRQPAAPQELQPHPKPCSSPEGERSTTPLPQVDEVQMERYIPTWEQNTDTSAHCGAQWQILETVRPASR
jgi:hypothetical protein